MSVTIFGSSSSKSNNTTKNYVDSKYISIIKNVNTKLDKGGDTMKGNLVMDNFNICRLGDPEEERDAVNKKYVDKLLETKRDKSEILSNTQDVATKHYVDSGEELAKIYTDSRETAVRMYIDSREAITRTYVDSREENVKLYIDHKYIKNSAGLIPDLTTNRRNKSGFIITAAGIDNSQSWQVFNSSKGDWQFITFPPQEEKWIKIRCPEPIKIHKFTIRGRESKPAKADGKEGEQVGKITNWKFQGSIDDNVWVDLYNGHMEHIDYEFKTFQIPSNAERYIYYRFFILAFTGENLGLNHLQIYSADPIM